MPIEGSLLLGRYTIQEKIAQGGMAAIYRGQDQRLHRPVCLKVFSALDRSNSLYQTVYEHFVQEAFALSQLQHPNILRIYDFGYLEDETGAPFQVAELMTGGTLNHYLHSAGTLSVAEMLEILEPLVGALAEAHGCGIVHRDIKPSNILFGAAGTRRIVKLADFGIAKVSMDQMRNRAHDTQQIVGSKVSLFSPGWAAPEQLRGGKVGPTADVFALGLLTAFMLTGRKVFPDDNILATIAERSQGDAYIESILTTFSLTQQAGAVVRRACRVDPRERYQTVDDLLAAFREPEPSPSQVSTRKFQKQPKPERQTVLLANLTEGTIVAAGRRVRLVAVPPQDLLDLESKPLRFRLTIFPSARGGFRMHIKGLNCFIARPGSRSTGALDIERDTTLDLQANDRKRAGQVRCDFGEPARSGDDQVFSVGDAALAVPRAEMQGAVLLDFGVGRDVVLLFRPRRV